MENKQVKYKIMNPKFKDEWEKLWKEAKKLHKPDSSSHIYFLLPCLEGKTMVDFIHEFKSNVLKTITIIYLTKDKSIHHLQKKFAMTENQTNEIDHDIPFLAIQSGLLPSSKRTSDYDLLDYFKDFGTKCLILNFNKLKDIEFNFFSNEATDDNRFYYWSEDDYNVNKKQNDAPYGWLLQLKPPLLCSEKRVIDEENSFGFRQISSEDPLDEKRELVNNEVGDAVQQVLKESTQETSDGADVPITKSVDPNHLLGSTETTSAKKRKVVKHIAKDNLKFESTDTRLTEEQKAHAALDNAARLKRGVFLNKKVWDRLSSKNIADNFLNNLKFISDKCGKDDIILEITKKDSDNPVTRYIKKISFPTTEYNSLNFVDYFKKITLYYTKSQDDSLVQKKKNYIQVCLEHARSWSNVYRVDKNLL